MNVRPERSVHVVDIRKQARTGSLVRHCLGSDLKLWEKHETVRYPSLNHI